VTTNTSYKHTPRRPSSNISHSRKQATPSRHSNLATSGLHRHETRGSGGSSSALRTPAPCTSQFPGRLVLHPTQSLKETSCLREPPCRPCNSNGRAPTGRSSANQHPHQIPSPPRGNTRAKVLAATPYHTATARPKIHLDSATPPHSLALQRPNHGANLPTDR
jgi:hypothetical protein